MTEPPFWADLLTRKVYFFQEGKAGPIKIGTTTKHPMERLRTLQCSTSRKLRIVAVIPAERPKEWRLHRAFRAARISGEWFRPCRKLMVYLRRLPMAYRCELSVGRPGWREALAVSPMKRIYRQFSGAKLKAARQELGISRERLAPFIGCTPMSIYNWESGKRTPGGRYLNLLAVQLRKTVEDFYDVSEGLDTKKG